MKNTNTLNKMEKEISNLSRKLDKVGKEAQALRWAFDQTGGYNAQNEHSKKLFSLVIKKQRECEVYYDKMINLSTNLILKNS